MSDDGFRPTRIFDELHDENRAAGVEIDVPLTFTEPDPPDPGHDENSGTYAPQHQE